MASLHFNIHIFRLFYGCDVHIIPDDTQSRIIALALGNPVEHLRSLLLHAMLSQGLTGNPQQVTDIAISPYQRTVRFDYSLFLLLEKAPEPVRDIVRQPGAPK